MRHCKQFNALSTLPSHTSKPCWLGDVGNPSSTALSNFRYCVHDQRAFPFHRHLSHAMRHIAKDPVSNGHHFCKAPKSSKVSKSARSRDRRDGSSPPESAALINDSIEPPISSARIQECFQQTAGTRCGHRDACRKFKSLVKIPQCSRINPLNSRCHVSFDKKEDTASSQTLMCAFLFLSVSFQRTREIDR